MAFPSKNSADQTSDDIRFDITRSFEPEVSLSRQEADIALAAELMRSGVATERDIMAAVSDWSLHGNVPLAEHLKKRDLLSVEQLDLLQGRAMDRVERARESVAGGSESPSTDESVLLATLERLDGSGRVAKMLGVTVAARGADQDSRVTEGSYELIRKLGQGGLGRVWLARDVNLNRYVALKEVSAAAAGSEKTIERFKYEAEITGRLDHPSIVPIYQLGVDVETKRVFYAMRFLGRSTLQDSIIEYHERREEGDEDPMLLRHLLSAFVNVCHAIGYAHSRKVIHRDLKPENVVIDSYGQVIVIDWGLAKIVDETSVESLMDSPSLTNGERTMEGQVLGTPLYMAPEQAAGRLDEMDQRTDIYGLGAILFSIVTGYAPHERTQKENSSSELGSRGMISAIAGGPTPAPLDAYPGADPTLDAICRKAMARRRYARYEQATDLGEDVQRWMAGEPVSAYEEPLWKRFGRWTAQHERLTQLMIAGTMVVLVAITTLAMSARQNHLENIRARFAEMDSDVREVEVQFRGDAAELSKDVRFISSLPPIEGIMSARAGVDGEEEAVWHDRLQTIFIGMLHSNPDYLALAFEAAQDGNAEDVVRVERNPADPSLVRSLPASRLHIIENDPLMADLVTLEPGDVRLLFARRTPNATGLDQFERLIVATPVFSSMTGEFFGITEIEADVSKGIRDAITGLGPIEFEMYIADGRGQVMAVAHPDQPVEIAPANQVIPNLPADVAERLETQGDAFELQKEDDYIARRFYVDPTGRGILIFARLLDK